MGINDNCLRENGSKWGYKNPFQVISTSDKSVPVEALSQRPGCATIHHDPARRPNAVIALSLSLAVRSQQQQQQHSVCILSSSA